MDTTANAQRRHAGWLEQQRREAAERTKPVIVELTGAELLAFNRIVRGAELAGHAHTVRVAIDGGLKIKINEGIWSHPLGEVQK